VCDVDAVDLDLSGGRLSEAADDAQSGGFSATARAEAAANSSP